MRMMERVRMAHKINICFTFYKMNFLVQLLVGVSVLVAVAILVLIVNCLGCACFHFQYPHPHPHFLFFNNLT